MTRRGSGGNIRTKRHMLPATAYAHDLTNPDPVGPSDMELDTWSQRSSMGSASNSHQNSSSSYLPGMTLITTYNVHEIMPIITPQ